jgi:EAL domain-containing protein (putative c-di-GMP-specific phosphodiesterase class I)/PAS domain-containing protein
MQVEGWIAGQHHQWDAGPGAFERKYEMASTLQDDAAAVTAVVPDRYRTFSFAAADLLMETDAKGRLSFVAGPFTARFGREVRSLLRGPAMFLIEPADHALFERALVQLQSGERLRPVLVHLCGGDGAGYSMTGLPYSDVADLSSPGGLAPVRRLAFAFAPLPATAAVGQTTRAGVLHQKGGALLRAVEAQLLAFASGAKVTNLPTLSLLELIGPDGRITPRPSLLKDITEVLTTYGGPGSATAELAPGRFGMVHADLQSGAPARPGVPAPNLGTVVEQLQAVLSRAGLPAATVSTKAFTLEEPASIGLSGPQAVRALRLALSTFAQGGTAALARTGFEGGLHGFLSAAGPRSAALARAIASRRFRLAFQPIVELSNRDRPPSHYEALIRPLPTEGLPELNPQDFVNMAEMLGLSVELDLAITDATLQALTRTDGTTRVACNVSGLSVQDPEFRARMVETLSAYPSNLWSRLLIEVTETAEIDNENEAVMTCDALRAHGVTLCVDDFGAGAAGIRYLRMLRPSIVKFDGGLMEATNGPSRNDGCRFAAALVELAQSTQADVVAERIETESDAVTACSFGARYGQGWLFGRPGTLPGILGSALFTPLPGPEAVRP